MILTSYRRNSDARFYQTHAQYKFPKIFSLALVLESSLVRKLGVLKSETWITHPLCQRQWVERMTDYVSVDLYFFCVYISSVYLSCVYLSSVNLSCGYLSCNFDVTIMAILANNSTFRWRIAYRYCSFCSNLVFGFCSCLIVVEFACIGVVSDSSNLEHS